MAERTSALPPVFVHFLGASLIQRLIQNIPEWNEESSRKDKIHVPSAPFCIWFWFPLVHIKHIRWHWKLKVTLNEATYVASQHLWLLWYSTTAVSRATNVSYLLGKHETRKIFSDVCNEGQPYHKTLKLTGRGDRGGRTIVHRDLIVRSVGSLCSYIWAWDKECFMI